MIKCVYFVIVFECVRVTDAIFNALPLLYCMKYDNNVFICTSVQSGIKYVSYVICIDLVLIHNYIFKMYD